MALIRKLGHDHDATATVKAGRLLFNPIGAGTSPSGRAIPDVVIVRGDGDQHSYKRAARDTYTGVTAHYHDVGAAERKSVGSNGDAPDGDGHKHLRKTHGSRADAQHAADAEDKRQKRGAATMRFTLALGRPELYPDCKVTLTGFKPEIDAKKWLISQATHTLGDSGMTTALELETA